MAALWWQGHFDTGQNITCWHIISAECAKNLTCHHELKTFAYVTDYACKVLLNPHHLSMSAEQYQPVVCIPLTAQLHVHVCSYSNSAENYGQVVVMFMTLPGRVYKC